jgi:hypothetical protein
MGLDKSRFGVIRFLTLSTVSSDATIGSSNSTSVSVGGTEGILFLATCIVAVTSDGPGATMDIRFSSGTTEGSDALASNATFSCTDAVVTFTTAQGIGAIIPIYVDTGRKGFSDRDGALFANVMADSVSRYSVIAIPFMAEARYPIAQTIATTVADD